MSATVFIQPERPLTIPVGAKQTFLDKLEKVFGPLPRTFTADDLTRLDTMIRLEDDASMRGGLEMVAEQIEQAGRVNVWVEY